MLESPTVTQVLRPSKRVTLLALLALNAGRIVSTSRLMAEIWGPTEPDTAANALHAQIARLRANFREWGCAGLTLRAEFPGYRLDLGDAVLDVHQFDTLARQARAIRDSQPEQFIEIASQALDLCRGNAFTGMRLGPIGEGIKARLDSDRVALLLDTIDVELELGRDHQLVPKLQELARNQPLCERSYGQLMIALYRTGRSGDALRTYADARRVFDAELGVEPSPILRKLFDRILHHDPRLWPAQSAVPATVG